MSLDPSPQETRSRSVSLEPDPILSTTQVGELFRVHPSTVTRWCDRGEIPFRRTDGGHRRILLSDALEKRAEEGTASELLEFGASAGSVWEAEQAVAEKGDVGPAEHLAERWLRAGEYEWIRELIVRLGRRHPHLLPAILDGVIRAVMARVGGDWEEGRIGVGSEHLASEIMSDALFKLRTDRAAERSASPHGGVALVGCAEGERHALGARCIRLLLEQRGWRVRFLGADVPLDEWSRLQGEYGAELVCISLSSIRAAGDVRRIISSLAAAYDSERPYALALGGGMVRMDGETADALSDAGPFLSSRVFAESAAFVEWLDELVR